VPGGPEGNRGTALAPARPACTPQTGSSDAPRDDGHTRLRERPRATIRKPGHRAPRALHAPRRKPPEPLDTKRHSFGVDTTPWAAHGRRCADTVDLAAVTAPAKSIVATNGPDDKTVQSLHG
jgi:hypothetical protein